MFVYLSKKVRWCIFCSLILESVHKNVELFKMVHKHYDGGSVAVKLTSSTIWGNKYKWQKCKPLWFNGCYYLDLFVWLSGWCRTISTFKSCLDRHWLDQDVVYNFHSELTGTGGASVCMWYIKDTGKEEYPRPFVRIELDWITHRSVCRRVWLNTAKDHKGALHRTIEDRQLWENCQTFNNFV